MTPDLFTPTAAQARARLDAHIAECGCIEGRTWCGVLLDLEAAWLAACDRERAA